MIPILIGALIIFGLPALYFAIRSREFRKFLAGAFFVSGGIQLYLYFTGVAVPIAGTDYIQTPALSGIRSVIHLLLFVLTFYTGFIRKPKDKKLK